MEEVFISGFDKFNGKEVAIKGWVTNRRESKTIVFLIVRDGTGFTQCVVAQEKTGDEIFSIARQLSLETAVVIEGVVNRDEKQIGGFELLVSRLAVLSQSENYPISNKPHGTDYLMDNRHLWLRSRRQWAIMRVRNQLIQAIHRYFQKNGFIQMDAPIFTGNACEGTSTLFGTDFFGQPAYLSQSGQLYGESMAFAHGKIYTFGPTFRAEKSKTRRHLSEFWMIEPEMAFYTLEDDMELIEDFMKNVVKDVLTQCASELKILERDTAYLENGVNKPFCRMTYSEAVKIIRGEKEVNGKNSINTLENDLKELQEKIRKVQEEIAERTNKTKQSGVKQGEISFHKSKIDALTGELHELEETAKNIPQWIESAKNFKEGGDFGGSDETVLTRLFDVPVMVFNWPHEVKAFYMKRDEKDSRYARGVDVLAPEGFGEIVGGGERETDLNLLIGKIRENELPMKEFEWYLDLRRYGSVPHSGFGLGLERFVAWICGLHHVRETIPFPRMYGRLFP
ncbi:MAG: asparagine--tRNA ligase [Bacteroidetes bacterium]|nr:asparagine--tRNA ligase [Bacteroidota bacterium]